MKRKTIYQAVIMGLSIAGAAQAQNVDLANLGAGGFRIDGIDAGDGSGRSVSGAGDVNGDGLADLIVGAFGAAPGGDSSAGESYVVYGKAGSDAVDLANLGAGGFRIDGVDVMDYSGRSVSGAGDVNGDGLADLIVGANGADPGGDSRAGESYVVFSQVLPPIQATYRARIVNGDAPQLVIGTTGDGSNASHPDSRSWIDFADGGDLTDPASNVIVTLRRNGGAFSDSAADISWQVQTNRLNWTSAEVQFRYLDSELVIGNENALQLVFSQNGSAPFTPLESSVVNPLDNTITAVVDELGFFYLGEVNPDVIFSYGFEE